MINNLDIMQSDDLSPLHNICGLRWAHKITEFDSNSWGVLKRLVAEKVLVIQSCLTLCEPIDYSPAGSSDHRILHARLLERVAISFPRGSSLCRNQIQVSCIASGLLSESSRKCPKYKVRSTKAKYKAKYKGFYFQIDSYFSYPLLGWKDCVITQMAWCFQHDNEVPRERFLRKWSFQRN